MQDTLVEHQVTTAPSAQIGCPDCGIPRRHKYSRRIASGRTRKGNVEVRSILTECAWSAGRTGTYVGARFRRMHRRFGKTGGAKAAIAIARTLIVIIWHVLHDSAPYRDLGSDYFTRHDNPNARKRAADPRSAIHGIRGHHRTGRLNPDVDPIRRPPTTRPN